MITEIFDIKVSLKMINHKVCFYFIKSGEIQAEKKFFHNGKAAATHIFYKEGC